MDKSKQYALMSKKSKLVWVPVRGDVFLSGRYRKITIFDKNHMGRKPCYYPRIWLPRQDQLQEMVGTNNNNYSSWVCKFCDLENFRQIHIGYTKTLNSMEQLWLAFVMQEKYQKTWNGKDWIK